MRFRCQAFDDGRFPGQTAQRRILSPAGFDLALHVPRGHYLEDGCPRNGIATAIPQEQPGSQEQRELEQVCFPDHDALT